MDDRSPQEDTLETVFVYGSLKRGFGNHWLLDGRRAHFIGVGRTAPCYDLLNLRAFPAAITGTHVVTGELYEVDAIVLADLDQLESNGRLYLRKKIPVVTAERQMSAWMYLYLQDDGSDELVRPIGEVVTWTESSRA